MVNACDIVQELRESQGFGTDHSLSLICQLTSEDIKHHFIMSASGI